MKNNQKNIRSSKLLFIVLLLLCMAKATSMKAQTGSSCSSAISLSTNTEHDDTTSFDTKWYSFTANDSILEILLKDISETEGGHVHIMSLYAGTCSGLMLLDQAFAYNDSTVTALGYSDSLRLIEDSLVINQVYYLKIERNAPSGVSCGICSGSNHGRLEYTLRIAPTILSVSFTFVQPDCYYPGCQPYYSGHLSGQASGNYQILVSQSGPFSAFNSSIDWVYMFDVNGGQVSPIPVPSTGTSNTIHLSGGTSYDIYLNIRIPCNTLGGVTTTITFSLIKRHLFQWFPVSTALLDITTCHSASAANSTLCLGSSTTLTATPPSTGTYTYSWSPATGLSNPTSAATTATPTTTTTYTCTITTTVSTCCPSIQDAVTVTVDQVSVKFTPDDDELCV